MLLGGNGTDVLSTTESGDTLMGGGGVNTLTSAGSFNNLIAGGGNDTLASTGTSDTLAAGPGVSTLADSGSQGTYWYASGNGQATIVNGSAASSGSTNQLSFASGVADNQLWFQQSGSNLIIDVMGTHSQVTVDGWFANAANQLQEIEVASGLKLDSQVAQLVQAMATYSAANPGFNPASAAQAPNNAALQNAVAASWHS